MAASSEVVPTCVQCPFCDNAFQVTVRLKPLLETEPVEHSDSGSEEVPLLQPTAKVVPGKARPAMPANSDGKGSNKGGKGKGMRTNPPPFVGIPPPPPICSLPLVVPPPPPPDAELDAHVLQKPVHVPKQPASVPPTHVRRQPATPPLGPSVFGRDSSSSSSGGRPSKVPPPPPPPPPLSSSNEDEPPSPFDAVIDVDRRQPDLHTDVDEDDGDVTGEGPPASDEQELVDEDVPSPPWKRLKKRSKRSKRSTKE